MPGGHLEFGERIVDAVCREAHEELGAIINSKDLRLISIVDDLQPAEEMHQVHISFEVVEPTWVPRVMEPERCEVWQYFPLSSLPAKLFMPHRGIIENYLNSRVYAGTQ